MKRINRSRVKNNYKKPDVPNKVTSSNRLGSVSSLIVIFIFLSAIFIIYYQPSFLYTSSNPNSNTYLSRHESTSYTRYDIPCHAKKKKSHHVPGCHKIKHGCGRVILDNFVSSEDIDQLREIAAIGMQGRSTFGGPTIMDINTGFVKDGAGLINLYQNTDGSPRAPIFTENHFQLYRRVIEKIRAAIVKEFQLESLYFTAPTFITRLVGNASWSPTEIHDEYWHLHVDKDNTKHYDYSGLLYLSTYEQEFTGGLFAFRDVKLQREQIVEPARGRLVMFTASKENLHQVKKVETGARLVMSMWFTCDERMKFHNFLDGKKHQHFMREDT